MSEKKVETVLVGFNLDEDEKKTILLVGTRSPSGHPIIINSIQGPEALDIYKKLIGEKTN